MNLQKVYAVLLTTDLAAAEDWYTRLLGRKPDNRPMSSLIQWELFDNFGLGVATDDKIAGRGSIFLYVEDVASERARLQAVDIEIGPDIQGDYSTLAQVRDADGNNVTLATPPSRPFPTS